jgi:hypothetical protein
MDEDSRPVRDGDPSPVTADAVRRHERLAALHEALAARGSGDVAEHARKAKAHREEAERLRPAAGPGGTEPGAE